ncbi:MAG: uracil-DNA glycosylase [Deltaproteobacteria bacterium]|nr:uracil-DNA glycosylase [Deltaproteobacteria bacterium]
MDNEQVRAEALRALRRSVADYIGFLAASGVRAVARPSPSGPAAPAGRAAPAPLPSIAADSGGLSTPPADEGLPLTLEEVSRELGDCTRCKLHAGRTHIVFGEGNPKAEILFIGEGPGEEEDKQARPFVGRAGKLLTDIIQKGMKLRREDVYIANIVKCRPPGNRDPEKDEIAACQPFLMKQIRAIGPKVIVTLGRPATSLLLGRSVQITRLRGQWQEFYGIPLMPTYHPAFVLRQYTPKNRGDVWEDMRKVLEKIGKPH